MNEGTRQVQQILLQAETRQQRRRAAIIHRKKFRDGRETPDDVEASVMPRGAFCPCGARPHCVARVFMPLKDVVERQGEGVGRLLLTHPEKFERLCVDLGPERGGVFVRVSTAYSCRTHLPIMERTLARKTPSWCLVDIDRGPEVMVTKRVVVGPSVFDAP